MPILAPEIELHPADLFDRMIADERDRCWWALYTRSRQEKQLMRKLLAQDIAFYSPIVARRYRSAAGRVRTSYQPLFANYVFLFGDANERERALKSNCISQCHEVPDGRRLADDLRNIQRLIEIGEPLTPEALPSAGDRVRVRNGMFAGFEGIVIRREAETRLLVAVNFMQQGASVLLDDCQLETLD